MTRGIKYISYGLPGGYGDAGRAYMRGLVAAGVPVTWVPIVSDERGHFQTLFYKATNKLQVSPTIRAHVEAAFPEEAPLVGRRIRYDTAIIHAQPTCWKASDRERRRLGKNYVGMTVWETTDFASTWAPMTRVVDKVIVPGPFSTAALRAAGVETPIAEVPHIAVPVGRGPLPAGLDVSDKTFVFYVIAMWTDRKAVYRTMEAYLRAFSADDDVLLVVKTSDGGWRYQDGVREDLITAEAARAVCERHPQGPRVHVITEHLSKAEIDGLHRRGDAFVSLTRGEGWCLPAHEAASAGTPVIITGWSEHVSYLPADVAHHVAYKLVPSAEQGGLWAEANLDDAVRCMRWVVAHRDEAHRRAATLADRLAGMHSQAVVTQTLLAAL